MLADIAKSAGLDAVAVKTYLDSDEDQEAVKQEALGMLPLRGGRKGEGS